MAVLIAPQSDRQTLLGASSWFQLLLQWSAACGEACQNRKCYLVTVSIDAKHHWRACKAAGRYQDWHACSSHTRNQRGRDACDL